MVYEEYKKSLKNSLRVEVPLVLLFIIGIFFLQTFSFTSAAPTGPDTIGIVSNETSTTLSGYNLNISGGRIATINITTSTQNVRWKAFVGNVTGSFALDDASGSTIYDWSLTTITGEIYATRNSSSISWATLNCSNITTLESENIRMNHTQVNDNITRTFNNGINGSHSSFFVATANILANSCPTLNTYVNNATQDTDFEEIVLYEPAGSNTIYATIMEEDTTGFDNAKYDFQMIVPEIGYQGFSGSTAYYIYVELT